jgi:hypothetical protein
MFPTLVKNMEGSYELKILDKSNSTLKSLHMYDSKEEIKLDETEKQIRFRYKIPLDQEDKANNKSNRSPYIGFNNTKIT